MSRAHGKRRNIGIEKGDIMANRSVELRNWNMWVVNRYATLVVDIPDGMDEAEAAYAITEYVSRDLDEGGEMRALFGRERKVGDPETSTSVPAWRNRYTCCRTTVATTCFRSAGSGPSSRIWRN